MLQSFIGQEGGIGFDTILLILIPLICCFMTMGQRGEKPQEAGSMSESFYTTKNIDESFSDIERGVAQWRVETQRKSDEPAGFVSGIRRFLGGGGQVERFIDKEKVSPRLYSLTDVTGPIFFEFTEVEGGGTVIKITYGSSLKDRVAKLKTGLPLKIPSVPIGLKCPSCGKSVLKEFNLCPYCGSVLIKE